MLVAIVTNITRSGKDVYTQQGTGLLGENANKILKDQGHYLAVSEKEDGSNGALATW